MKARRLGAVALASTLAGSLALAGCGSGSAQHAPTVGQLPLVPGARIEAEARQCDKGSSAYCAIDLVVLDHRYNSSDALASDERKHLQKAGWSIANGDTGVQTAANSPHHSVRVTFASAVDDLEGIDFSWISRPWPITYALSNSVFDRNAAMSMMLEVGGT